MSWIQLSQLYERQSDENEIKCNEMKMKAICVLHSNGKCSYLIKLKFHSSDHMNAWSYQSSHLVRQRQTVCRFNQHKSLANNSQVSDIKHIDNNCNLNPTDLVWQHEPTTPTHPPILALYWDINYSQITFLLN